MIYGTWRNLTTPAVWRLVIFLALTLSIGAQAVVFEVDFNGDTHDLNPGDGICRDADENCSLRAALEEASATGSVDTILFADSVTLITPVLGTLEIAGDSLAIVAHRTTIDGVYLLPFQSTLVISGSHNHVFGLQFYRAHRFGLEISSRSNRIDSCVFLKCGVESPDGGGLLIRGDSAYENVIANSWFGVGGNGTEVYGNRIGIRIMSGANRNVIGQSGEGNLVSGNLTWGVEILSGNDNQITASFIGLDLSETNGPGNLAGGVRISDGAKRNRIGGLLPEDGNVISFNDGDGVRIEGIGTDSTLVMGNIIGLQPNGNLLAPNFNCGITVTGGAQYTQIGGATAAGRNIISGNAYDGIRISGESTRFTLVRNNLVGTDRSGYAGRYNGWIEGGGITIADGATYTMVGGTKAGDMNVISGNNGFGVLMVGPGTSDNVISGNMIGAAVDGGSPVSNGTGVGIIDGANSNVVGGSTIGSGNVISGNRADVFPLGAGVVVSGSGTAGNRISGNIIGLDVTGSVRMRNQSSGVIIGDCAQDNVVGGPTPEYRNIISGNGSDTVVANLGRGIHVFGIGTSRNIISGNWIGAGYDGTLKLPNRGIGISVTDGATDCVIGGEQSESGNRICYNRGHGVAVSGDGSSRVSIRQNEIFSNDSLGIAIRGGAQNGIAAPVLNSATSIEVQGIGAPAMGTVDIYLAANDPSGQGEGRLLVGSGKADQNGNFVVAIYGASATDSVTAIATDLEGNSSAFATNISVEVASGVGDGTGSALPQQFSLFQNYPNPFNPSTAIPFSLSARERVQLQVLNSAGQSVRHLMDEVRSAGSYTVEWNGKDDSGKPVASGTYFYRLTTGSGRIAKKMLLLR